MKKIRLENKPHLNNTFFDDLKDKTLSIKHEKAPPFPLLEEKEKN